MRRWLWLALLLLPCAMHAQVVGPGFINYVTSAPSGTCSQGEQQRNVIGLGTVYTCQSGTWATVGGGGGSGTVTGVLGTTNQINSDGSTTTPTLSLSSTLVLPGTLTGNGTVLFATTSAAAQFLSLKNTTAAVVGTSQGSPIISTCGTAFHGSASVESCGSLSILPGNGNDAEVLMTLGLSGTSTGPIFLNIPGNANGQNVAARMYIGSNNTATQTVTIGTQSNKTFGFRNNANNGDIIALQKNTSDQVTVGTSAGTALGSGAFVKAILTNTATLDFANQAAIGCNDLTITVTGAAVGDTVSIGVPNASVVNGTATFSGWVSGTNTVTVRYCNLISGDPASGTFRATVTQF